MNEKTLLFSVGSHPGFRCPLHEGEKMEDYYLLFEKPERLNRLLENGGLLTGETKAFLDGEREKTLSHSLFPDGELTILEKMASRWLEIRNRVNDRVIRFEFGEFPYLGIWSAKNDAPFVCIEPWHGIHSTRGESSNFETKKGLQKVAPGKFFECGFTVAVE